MYEGMPAIMITGKTVEQLVGVMLMSCHISKGWSVGIIRIGMGKQPGEGRMVRFILREEKEKTHFMMPSLKLAMRLVMNSQMIIMVKSKRALV